MAYHEVSPRGENRSPYEVTQGLLARQLEEAISIGYRFVPLRELVSSLREGDGLAGKISVTFDDAYIGFASYAVPILQRLGIPATVFAPTEGLGRPPRWLQRSSRLVTEGELRSLALTPGIDVESHGRSHESLAGLSSSRQRAELRGSKERLESLLGQTVEFFAYPYGEYGQETPSLAREAGYGAAFTFMSGRLSTPVDPYRLPRLVMHRGRTEASLRYMLLRPGESFKDHQLPCVPPRAGQRHPSTRVTGEPVNL